MLAEEELSWEGSTMSGTKRADGRQPVTAVRQVSAVRRACEVMLTALAALAVVLMTVLGAAPSAVAAPAASHRPTLTIHATHSSQQSQATEMESLLPAGATPAGAGYIFRLTQLDAGRVMSVPGNAGERTRTILDHPDRYVLSAAPVVYGVTDSDGVVSNRGTGRQGDWLVGARYDASTGRLTDGRSERFEGTESSPSYWWITLVRGPKGGETFEPGLIELPYKNGGQDGRTLVWNVQIYPKVTEKGSTPVVPPTPPHEKHPTLPTKLAKTGTSILWLLVICALLVLAWTSLRALAERHADRNKGSVRESDSVEEPGA